MHASEEVGALEVRLQVTLPNRVLDNLRVSPCMRYLDHRCWQVLLWRTDTLFMVPISYFKRVQIAVHLRRLLAFRVRRAAFFVQVVRARLVELEVRLLILEVDQG